MLSRSILFLLRLFVLGHFLLSTYCIECLLIFISCILQRLQQFYAIFPFIFYTNHFFSNKYLIKFYCLLLCSILISCLEIFNSIQNIQQIRYYFNLWGFRGLKCRQRHLHLKVTETATIYLLNKFIC